MTNIIVPGSTLNQDPTQWTYEFIDGPLHGSKLPVHPAIVRAGTEVGLEVGGKMQCYRAMDKEKSDGKKYRVYVYNPT